MKLAPVRRADRILMILLIAADIITIPFVFMLTWVLRTLIFAGNLPEFHHQLNLYLLALPLVAVLWIFSFARAGLYRPKRHLGSMGELQQLLKAFIYLLVALMAVSYLVRMEYSRLILFMFIGISIPGIALSRYLARKIAHVIAPVREAPRILIVGTGEVAARVITALRRLPGKAPELAGVVTSTTNEKALFEDVEIVSSLDDIVETISRLNVDEVFFAAPELDRSRILEIISLVENTEVHYRLVTDLFEIALGVTDVDDLAKLPIVEIGYGEPGALHRITKRFMDVAISSVLLLVLFPLMSVIYLLQLIRKNGSPVFSQKRVGLRGKEFTLYKFRTMKPESDEYEVAPISMIDSRVTGIGRFLRRTSLDELPQLFNILQGDMSLVGPRPEMPFIVDKYTSWQRHRLDVKPGLTGMWQIMGRKELPLHDNLEYDYYYIRNQSLMLDFTILLRTIAIIFKGRGAY
ncbi:MAG: exopolysaccharide biosynthesis polyprenyl glycosylphosphotransferase [Candidatus Aegiribacteria sp.]|nr:exopolysaccharide biosynthesis polyprenyl glycosylphosphotransferase [Candidatus Aegiribacteria sp.]